MASSGRVASFALLAAAACAKPAPQPLADAAANEPAAQVAPADAGAAPTTDASQPASAPVPKKYARVLHTGDSMVGGGLTRALGPMFTAEGTKYHRDVVESGTIHEFSQSERLPKLIAKVKPDLVVITLGANHIPNSVDPEKEIGPYVAKLIKRVAAIDCYWIAPPTWKPAQAAFNQWLGEHVAPCRFYDGSKLEISRRADKIHPDEAGGEIWAADFWRFFKGEGAFFERPQIASSARAALLP